MHSFHHSANAITFITGARHLWMERVLASAVLPIMPVLFQIPPDMQFILSLIYFIPDTCAHLNVRFPMGRMITLVNSPQWHRIHHSAMPEHRDKNFASLLPLWDILFGTAWIPKADEYPVTGFDPPVRVSVVDSIIWPLRDVRLPATREHEFWARFQKLIRTPAVRLGKRDLDGGWPSVPVGEKGKSNFVGEKQEEMAKVVAPTGA
jgi:hypothetical protein